MIRCTKGNRARSMTLSVTPSVQDSASPGGSLGTSSHGMARWADEPRLWRGNPGACDSNVAESGTVL
jgi:hypothetical protein